MKKILIVDDERPVRDLLKKILEANGYETCAAADAKEARDCLTEGEFDLLLTDINMPGESGLDLARYVKGKHPETAIVIISVLDDPRDARSVLEIDVYGYIVKPFEPNQVLITIDNALRRSILEKREALRRKLLEGAVDYQARVSRQLMDKLEGAETALTAYTALIKDQLVLLETILDAVPAPIFYKDTEGRYLGCNAAFETFIGHPRRELVGKTVYEISKKELADVNFEADMELIRKEGRQVYEGKVGYADGSIHEVIFNKAVYRDSQGKVAGIVGAMVDITQRREMERRLSESESRMKTLWDSILTGVLVIDEETHTILDANPYALEVLGLSRDKLIGCECHGFVCPTERGSCPVTDLNITIKKAERCFMTGDGQPLPILKTITRTVVGGRKCLVESFVDISGLREAERAWRLTEEKNRHILENVGIGVTMISPDMEILEMNRQMREWFPHIDVERKPICYRSFNDPPRESPCEMCPTSMTLHDGQVHDVTVQAPGRPEPRAFRIISSPIHDTDGRVVAAIELVDNVTERFKLEKELRQAQKLESIGQLAAGIAHEINTPTQYVGDNTRFLKDAFGDLLEIVKDLEDLLAAVKKEAPDMDLIRQIERRLEDADLPYLEEEIPRAIEQSLEGIDRVTRIVRSMKEFSHPGGDEKMSVDINRALESTITVARNEWKYVADLETDFAEDLPLVPCFPGELNQVFLNIIINAAHAIGEKQNGEINGKGLIRISSAQRNGSVEVCISDTGGGIPQHIQHRIFDPFFTTKEVGRGTGQGLAIAHRVVIEKHKGSLTFRTEEGVGTTFRILLPLERATEQRGAQ